MSSTWSVCPVCAVVTGDAAAHAAWHEWTTRAIDPMGTPTTATGTEYWPAGLAVVEPPAGPSPKDAVILARIITESRAYLADAQRALTLLDTYRALSAPTQAQVVAQVKTLSRITRGAILALADVVRATIWRAKEDQ